jgi:RNA ligase (TIGR02306 family)
MSKFAVTVEEIARVWTHPNADLLEMAQLKSMTYQFVIGKGQHQPGDRVVYFPIDSVLPPNLIETLHLTGKLAGSEHNRIKTVRLRGEISQGLVALPADVIPGWTEGMPLSPGQDVTELLGVTKYEPPIVPNHAGRLVSLPKGVGVYDIEGAERFADIVSAYLLDQPVIITEKLEGSHFAASLLGDGSLAVSQRHHRIEPVEGQEHDWHKVARTSGLADALPAMKAVLEARLGRPIHVLTVRGEVLGPGVQKNIYKLPDHRVYVFDIEADGAPIDAKLYLEMVEQFGLAHAPVLAAGVLLRDWLAGRTLADASNGKSVLQPEVAREGVVIRPMREQTDEVLGRVIIKQRSPEYLSKSDF